MAVPSHRILELIHALIRNGIVEEEAVTLAQSAMNSFPSLKGRKNPGDFAAIMETLKASAKYSTVAAARKAMKGKPSRKLTEGPKTEIRLGWENGDEENYFSVFTTLPTAFINAALVATLEEWVSFAQGKSSVGGRSLKHPSGRYASSLELKQRGPHFYTIYSKAQHAGIIEQGRKRFNLQDYASQYGNYAGGYARVPIGDSSLIKRAPGIRLRTVASSTRLRVYSQGNQAAIQSNYGRPKKGSGSGRHGDGAWRMMSPNGPRSSWNIPAMRAYHPAWHYAEKLQKQFNFEQRLLQ